MLIASWERFSGGCIGHRKLHKLRVRWKIIIVLLAAAMLVAIGLLPRHILGSRVVARVVTPDGSELCVIQRGSFDELPWFNTSFFSRRPGGTWQWFYFHHEDKYWGRSRVSIVTNARLATFYRRGSPAIGFDWGTGSYTNVQRHRTCDPKPMPAGWSPF